MPLQIGKTPIVVPRQHQFNEHVNDHQVEFSRNVAKRMGTIIEVEDIETLGDVITNYDRIVAGIYAKYGTYGSISDRDGIIRIRFANGLTDYKFYCFNGVPKYLYVSNGMDNHETARLSFLTMNWEKAPFGRSDYLEFEVLPPKPTKFDEMVKIAKSLSGGHPFLRVDLYEINNKVYFSELTFSPCGGFMPFVPEEWDAKLGEMVNIRKVNARAEVEKAETPEAQEAAAPGETPQPANTEEPKKPRRGRPPKAEKAATENQKSEKSAGTRKGRPPKADKTAPDKPKPSKRDKVSRSDGKAPDAKEPIKPAQDTAPKETATAEQTAPEPTTPPRPVEEGKLVYLKLSEVHPFHTFRPHPFKVRDDAKMQEIVASIRVNGVMVPGLARPEKDGNGYEIVAGHRRTHGSELAGLEEMPFIVREMTDHEAVQAMKDSNKQRDGMLPSELAALLELEVEDIKHQGGRLKGVAEGDVGKRSVEIVGEAHEMNYKKVMRYLRLNSLVPELLDKVDDKKMGFMPAVELSYIKPKNQRLIAVSIDGEQASPSLAQAKRLRELDKEGKLNGDVIDGILSEQKKEDRGVIISTAELEKYFGKEVTPAKMKEQIMSLLDDWKEKQPPELAKAPKKQELDK